MKNISTLLPINLKPVICISHEGLKAIEHIVSIAPQEAQWFNCVTPRYETHSPELVYLDLSTELYIPKQTTSLAEVDSTGDMLVEFYNELKESNTSIADTNRILSSMTCWSHSHHKMSPNPSGQDVLQFNSFIKMSQSQNQAVWQVMLIFNKKNQFYSRVYDPRTQLILEGVDMIVGSNYDFSYITKAAKSKFLARPIPTFKFKGKQEVFEQYLAESQMHGSLQSANSYENNDFDSHISNTEVVDEILSDLYHYDAEDITSLAKQYSSSARVPKKTVDSFIDSLFYSFDNIELLYLLAFLKQDKKLLLKLFSKKDELKASSEELNVELKVFFSATRVTIKHIRNQMLNTLDYSDLDTLAACKTFLAKKISKKKANI